LQVTGELDRTAGKFALTFAAQTEVFGGRSAGAPFNVYSPVRYGNNSAPMWPYAVQAGQRVTDAWSLAKFEHSAYHLRAYGPNGFYREFRGGLNDPPLVETCALEMTAGKRTGNLVLTFSNRGNSGPLTVEIIDHAYGAPRQSKAVAEGETATIIDLSSSHHWYDFSLTIADHPAYERRLAGRVEIGALGTSDPAMA
jgi:phospholipase C